MSIILDRTEIQNSEPVYTRLKTWVREMFVYFFLLWMLFKDKFERNLVLDLFQPIKYIFYHTVNHFFAISACEKSTDLNCIMLESFPRKGMISMKTIQVIKLFMFKLMALFLLLNAATL